MDRVSSGVAASPPHAPRSRGSFRRWITLAGLSLGATAGGLLLAGSAQATDAPLSPGLAGQRVVAVPDPVRAAGAPVSRAVGTPLSRVSRAAETPPSRVGRAAKTPPPQVGRAAETPPSRVGRAAGTALRTGQRPGADNRRAGVDRPAGNTVRRPAVERPTTRLPVHPRRTVAGSTTGLPATAVDDARTVLRAGSTAPVHRLGDLPPIGPVAGGATVPVRPAPLSPAPATRALADLLTAVPPLLSAPHLPALPPVPPLPGLPLLPGGLPALPPLPLFPGLPQLPGVPVLPGVPAWPDLPPWPGAPPAPADPLAGLRPASAAPLSAEAALRPAAATGPATGTALARSASQPAVTVDGASPADHSTHRPAEDPDERRSPAGPAPAPARPAPALSGDGGGPHAAASAPPAAAGVDRPAARPVTVGTAALSGATITPDTRPG